MLKTSLQHPEILAALAGAGHSSKILVADANFPFDTVVGENARIVYLNLSPGTVKVPEVVQVLHDTIPFETVAVNVPADGKESEVAGEVRAIVAGVPVEKLGRFEFYDAVRSPDLCLTIATGESRIYSCALITIGYIAG
jgi:L-fucose mutarotase